MLEQRTINYYVCIPPSLHKDVDALIYYLTVYPFEQPSYCAHCGSINFSDNKTVNPLSEIINYRCIDCKRGFNQLTNTCFAKTRFVHLHKWADFAKLRLAGSGINKISKQLHLSTQAATGWDRRINTLIQQQFPKLFTWWKAHQDRDKLDFAEPVSQQASQFIQWLEKRITAQIASCPSCGRVDCKRTSNSLHRPQFRCHSCDIGFSLLSDTCFLNMHHTELWVDYTKLLTQGFSDSDISKQLGIKPSLSSAWRRKFIKQMQLLNFTELVQWLTWQRSRRYNQVSQEVLLAKKLYRESY